MFLHLGKAVDYSWQEKLVLEWRKCFAEDAESELGQDAYLVHSKEAIKVRAEVHHA